MGGETADRDSKAGGGSGRGLERLQEAAELLQTLALLEKVAMERHDRIRELLSRLMADHGYDFSELGRRLRVSPESLQALLTARADSAVHDRLGISAETVEGLLEPGAPGSGGVTPAAEE